MRDRFERPLPRRFYKDVTVSSEGPPFSILLDGRPVKTPMKALLALPSQALAEAVAKEWAAQEETINPFSMPLTRIANAAIDRVQGRRAAVMDDLLKIARHDMLCYRVAHPAELAAQQAALWDPLLAWAEEALDARLVVSADIMPHPQPKAALSSLKGALVAFDDFSLAAISTMAGLAHSLVIALAVAHGRIDPETAWQAANVEEDWNISQWGEDVEAAARRRANTRDFLAAARMLTLIS